MQQFKAVQGQNLLDVCLNTYGSLESLFQLVMDNDLKNINDTVLSQQVFNWNPSSDTQQVSTTYATNNNIFFLEDTYLDGIIDDSNNLLSDTSNNNIT
ncbi:MAG: hypothetical protein M3Z26_00605 [Bacteroidota bacterium]|nr:hypothetical protein [Bacteroidota bacterium]